MIVMMSYLDDDKTPSQWWSRYLDVGSGYCNRRYAGASYWLAALLIEAGIVYVREKLFASVESRSGHCSNPFFLNVRP